MIGGYSEPAGSRAAFGALLLGVYDGEGKLRYAGRVGTGFDAALLRSVKKELDAHETSRMPFASAPRERSRTPVHWVEPELVAECNFAEWTSDGIVRQASFVESARRQTGAADRQGSTAQRSRRATANRHRVRCRAEEARGDEDRDRAQDREGRKDEQPQSPPRKSQPPPKSPACGCPIPTA